ncbi:hypothetical protein H072_6051 [Dactylellina haptotyla CBS 200.50]|uniref:Uncharacterized protein n=1 Tax=Dactylellina haptotyla (strain CBS 200.50) TaxID=1284197 RepID=S8BL28_DACHA|nr:hypothetical protein H072_6051 [Dactylellina haptotyla CBS 200.50]
MNFIRSLVCFKSQNDESAYERVSIACYNFLRYGSRRPNFNLDIWDDDAQKSSRSNKSRPMRDSSLSFAPSKKRSSTPSSQVSSLDDLYPPAPPAEFHPVPTPSRVSEKHRNVDRNETYILNHPFFGNNGEEMLVFNLGYCHLNTVNHPDYLTISLLDTRNIAELEISISRYSRRVIFNQQNPNETWKKEHIYRIEDLFADGEVNEIQIWTEERFTSDNYVWYEYMVKTPRRLISTEIMCFETSPKVRFLQIFERTDPPMLQQSHIEVSHYNHNEDM